MKDSTLNESIDDKNNKNDDVTKKEISESCSSDDSYVKVIAFASTDNLYSDLTDFAQEVHSAPRNLTSCTTENADELSKQVFYF